MLPVYPDPPLLRRAPTPLQLTASRLLLLLLLLLLVLLLLPRRLMTLVRALRMRMRLRWRWQWRLRPLTPCLWLSRPMARTLRRVRQTSATRPPLPGHSTSGSKFSTRRVMGSSARRPSWRSTSALPRTQNRRTRCTRRWQRARHDSLALGPRRHPEADPVPEQNESPRATETWSRTLQRTLLRASATGSRRALASRSEAGTGGAASGC